MKSYAISAKIRNLFKNIYNLASSSLLAHGELGELFKMMDESRHGDTGSPNAFLIFLERSMDGVKKMERKFITVHGQNICITCNSHMISI